MPPSSSSTSSTAVATRHMQATAGANGATAPSRKRKRATVSTPTPPPPPQCVALPPVHPTLRGNRKRDDHRRRTAAAAVDDKNGKHDDDNDDDSREDDDDDSSSSTDSSIDDDDDDDDDDRAPPRKRTRRHMARVTAPSPGTKRCCKKDLKRCLRVGEILEVTRVEQHYLDEYNGGQKIRARFTGQDFYDLSKNSTYRSLSQWVKKRLVDVGALGVNSNISGWDFVAVERDGRKQSLRMIVDNENENASGSASSDRSTPPTNAAALVEQFFGLAGRGVAGDAASPAGTSHVRVAHRTTMAPATTIGGGGGSAANEFSIAERMQQLCREHSESSASASASPPTCDVDADANRIESVCQSLRAELARARAYVGHIEQQLIVNEKCLKAIRLQERPRAQPRDDDSGGNDNNGANDADVAQLQRCDYSLRKRRE